VKRRQDLELKTWMLEWRRTPIRAARFRSAPDLVEGATARAPGSRGQGHAAHPCDGGHRPRNRRCDRGAGRGLLARIPIAHAVTLLVAAAGLGGALILLGGVWRRSDASQGGAGALDVGEEPEDLV